MPTIIIPLSALELTVILLNKDIISEFINPAINNAPTDIDDNVIYIAKPINIDLIIFKLFELYPIIIPNIPLIIINKNSKNTVIIITNIKLNTELSKYIADCSKEAFNINQLSLSRELIAKQRIITQKEANNVIIEVF